jgi:hypothetical protein
MKKAVAPATAVMTRHGQKIMQKTEWQPVIDGAIGGGRFRD